MLKPMEVFQDDDGQKEVNIDTLSEEGLDRAATLNTATSGEVDLISASLTNYAASSLFSPSHQGRLFTMLRHPIDRALHLYLHLVTTNPSLQEMTIEEYATSHYAPGDWMTRFLSENPYVPTVTEYHSDIAKEILRTKSLIGLWEEQDESMRRIRSYFGLEPMQEDDEANKALQMCQQTIEHFYPAHEAEVTNRLKSMVPLEEGDEAYAALEAKNRYDLELYRYAKTLFAAQVDLPVQVVQDSVLKERYDSKIWTEDRNCVENGSFDGNPIPSNWYAVQAAIAPTLGANNQGNAILVTNRKHQIFGGAWQNIHTDCLKAGEWYVVKATVQTTMAGTNDVFVCDPSIIFNNKALSCPGIGLRIGNDMHEVALAIGPINPTEQWINLYGVFQATPDMFQQVVSLFISRAPPEVDLAIDNVSVSPARDTSVGIMNCSHLIRNGDAEVGDHRFWFIRGQEGADSIDVVSPGHGGSGYAFRHKGKREKRWRGMLQPLDSSCFLEGSTWKITAWFRYFSIEDGGSEVAIACSKANLNASDSCPVFELEFITSEGNSLSTGPLLNTAVGDLEKEGWNEIQHTFTVTPDVALQPFVKISINSVDPAYNYELDDIQMTRV